MQLPLSPVPRAATALWMEEESKLHHKDQSKQPEITSVTFTAAKQEATKPKISITTSSFTSEMKQNLM